MPKSTHTVNSFEKLFKDNYAKLCHFALQFLKDEDMAKDIVQETFAAFWDAQETLQLEE